MDAWVPARGRGRRNCFKGHSKGRDKGSGKSCSKGGCNDINRLLFASEQGCIDEVRMLLAEGARLDVRKRDGGETPLFCAVSEGHVEVVHALLEARARTDESTHCNSLPIDRAVGKGKVELVQALLVARCSLSSRRSVDYDGRKYGETFIYCPLICSMGNGHIEVVRALLAARALVNDRDEEGRAPLFFAAMHGHIKVTQMLLEANANVNNGQYGRDSCTPLHIAIARGHLKVVQWLCMFGATQSMSFEQSYYCRLFEDPTALGLAKAHRRSGIAQFLYRTQGYNNPLQYVEHFSIDEARYWLCSEHLKQFPSGYEASLDLAVAGESEACHLVASAFVWREEVHSLFPASCRKLVKLLLLVWNRCARQGVPPRALLLNRVLPFLLSRVHYVLEDLL